MDTIASAAHGHRKGSSVPVTDSISGRMERRSWCCWSVATRHLKARISRSRKDIGTSIWRRPNMARRSRDWNEGGCAVAREPKTIECHWPIAPDHGNGLGGSRATPSSRDKLTPLGLPPLTEKPNQRRHVLACSTRALAPVSALRRREYQTLGSWSCTALTPQLGYGANISRTTARTE